MSEPEILKIVVTLDIVFVFNDKALVSMGFADSLAAEVADFAVSLSEGNPHPRIARPPRSCQFLVFSYELILPEAKVSQVISHSLATTSRNICRLLGFILLSPPKVQEATSIATLELE